MRILSLDGGGYLGLATAAFLKEAEGHFRTSCHERFDFFVVPAQEPLLHSHLRLE